MAGNRGEENELATRVDKLHVVYFDEANQLLTTADHHICVEPLRQMALGSRKR